jgi:heme/copper-type cytochrome/quinol oxidase subunit 2
MYQLRYYVQEPGGQISYASNRYIIIIIIIIIIIVIIITIIIIIIIILFITFMQDMYNYIPETNHVSRVYSVAVVL